MEIFEKLDILVESAISWMGIYGPIFGCLLMCIESIIPILPLSVFITLNFLTFGNLLGFMISWICTLIGCCISFWIFRSGVKNWFDKRFRIMVKVNQVMNFIDKASFNQLIMVVALPFTPAFLVNIAAGLSRMCFKKFFISIFFGKILMVYFWGFVGTSLLQSLRDPMILIQVVIIMLIAYILSKILNKKFDLG